LTRSVPNKAVIAAHDWAQGGVDCGFDAPRSLPRGDRIETESPGARMVRQPTKAQMENGDAVQTRGQRDRQRTPALAEPTFLEPVQIN
jgi:hypothetical protein